MTAKKPTTKKPRAKKEDHRVHVTPAELAEAKRRYGTGIYNPKTTFYQDFSIAENFGQKAVLDTYKRAFSEWKENTVYVVELMVVLNRKIHENYDYGHMPLARTYNELYFKVREYCLKTLKGVDMEYYFYVTD